MKYYSVHSISMMSDLSLGFSVYPITEKSSMLKVEEKQKYLSVLSNNDASTIILNIPFSYLII